MINDEPGRTNGEASFFQMNTGSVYSIKMVVSMFVVIMAAGVRLRHTGSLPGVMSPKHLSSLKLLQININGITPTTTRFKLDQVLELVENYDVKIIVLQESKLFISRLRTMISIGQIDKIRVVEA
ncbi:hypothetical protein TNCV_4498001 [Trichonephila clavipes]|nr:hypothetical protein TNCV_4498001 [Trichonephila clavipes]